MIRLPALVLALALSLCVGGGPVLAQSGTVVKVLPKTPKAAQQKKATPAAPKPRSLTAADYAAALEGVDSCEALGAVIDAVADVKPLLQPLNSLRKDEFETTAEFSRRFGEALEAAVGGAPFLIFKSSDSYNLRYDADRQILSLRAEVLGEMLDDANCGRAFCAVGVDWDTPGANIYGKDLTFAVDRDKARRLVESSVLVLALETASLKVGSPDIFGLDATFARRCAMLSDETGAYWPEDDSWTDSGSEALTSRPAGP